MKNALTLIASAALLAACAGPEPQRPTAADAAATAVPATFPQAGGPGDTAAVDLPWAQAFQGDRLQRLIPLALANNRDLRIAALNIESARATAAARDADLWPTVSAAASGSRVSTPAGITSAYQAGLQVSAYELDVFGRLRGLSAAAQAQVLASQANAQAVRIALVASVANAEIALQADEALLKITRATLDTREQSTSLTRQRYDGGVAGELDLRSAESSLQSARAVYAQAQRQRQLDENALALLIGGPLPAGLPAPSGDLADFEPLAELPAGLPSEVLLRRPDIRQAEFLLRAADANIGAARAAFWPRITLTASAGTASAHLSDLFKHAAWSFAPALVQPIFDAGRNRANLDSARASRDIALAQYEKAIQSGFREVADGLASRATLADQRTALLAQVDAERRRLSAAEQRYGVGVSSALDLLDAQRSLFAAQQTLVQVQSLRAQNLVVLYRALGGG